MLGFGKVSSVVCVLFCFFLSSEHLPGGQRTVMGVDGVRAYCKRHPEVSAVLVENPVDEVLRPIHINKGK